jgi:class 3 adenylate cyclase
LRGFTAFAETAAPEELFEVLREYHRALGELIPTHQGTLEHFAQILIGQRVFAAVEEAVEATPVGELELKGFGRPVAAYEVNALRGS